MNVGIRIASYIYDRNGRIDSIDKRYEAEGLFGIACNMHNCHVGSGSFYGIRYFILGSRLKDFVMLPFQQSGVCVSPC